MERPRWPGPPNQGGNHEHLHHDRLAATPLKPGAGHPVPVRDGQTCRLPRRHAGAPRSLSDARPDPPRDRAAPGALAEARVVARRYGCTGKLPTSIGPAGKAAPFAARNVEPSRYRSRNVTKELEPVAAGLMDEHLGNAAVFADAPAVHAPARPDCKDIVIRCDG